MGSVKRGGQFCHVMNACACISGQDAVNVATCFACMYVAAILANSIGRLELTNSIATFNYLTIEKGSIRELSQKRIKDHSCTC
jgi:hypothetical protein